MRAGLDTQYAREFGHGQSLLHEVHLELLAARLPRLEDGYLVVALDTISAQVSYSRGWGVWRFLVHAGVKSKSNRCEGSYMHYVVEFCQSNLLDDSRRGVLTVFLLPPLFGRVVACSRAIGAFVNVD